MQPLRTPFPFHRKPKFEIKADFGGINGWPADVSVVNFLSAQVSYAFESKLVSS